ncbi:MAG: DUF3604 domain-containing protein [Pirellulaceae bacterium]
MVNRLIIALALVLAVDRASGGDPLPTASPPRGASASAVDTETELRVVRDPRAFATLNREFTWELVWQPVQSLAPGTRLQLRCRNLRTLVEWTHRGVELQSCEEVTWESLVRPRSGDALASMREHGVTLGEGILPRGFPAGGMVFIRVRAVPPHFAHLDDTLSIWLSAPRDDQRADANEAASAWVRQERAAVVLHVGPGPVERLAVYSHPMPSATGTVRTVLSPEDRFGNTTAFDSELPLSLTWNGRTWTELLRTSRIIELDRPQSVERLQVTVEARNLSSGDNISNGRVVDGRILVQGNPVWPTSPAGKLAVFGEFHWHSELSGDGSGRLVDGMQLARDQLNLSYCMASDHWPRGEQWEQYVAVMDEFNQTDRFATMYGYEAGSPQGHDNFYFLDADNPLAPDGVAGELCRLPPEQYQQELDRVQRGLSEYQKVIAIPHHTNADSETLRPDGTPYWPAYRFTRGSETHRLIEVFQTRGNMERNEYTDAWRGWYARGASVQDALAAGYRLGFTGGTDNHCARPACCFDWKDVNRGRIPLHSQSLTGVWVDRLDRRSVWKALYDRHTWAAWDTRALVHFAVNGILGGGELVVDQGQPLRGRARISAEDSLQSLEIVSDGNVVWSTSVEPLDCDLTMDLGTATRKTHFYLRALQRNGGIFYASPVFVTPRLPD